MTYLNKNYMYIIIVAANNKNDIFSIGVHHHFCQMVAICLVLPIKRSPDDCLMPVRCPTRHLSTPTRHVSDRYHIYSRLLPYAHQKYNVPYVDQMFT